MSREPCFPQFELVWKTVNRFNSASGQEGDPISCRSSLRHQFCKGCDLEGHTRVHVHTHKM